MKKSWLTGTYPTIDPYFDEMGGELTLAQISSPVPTADEDAASYLDRCHRRIHDKIRYQRYKLRQLWERLKEARQLQLWRARERLQRLITRFLNVQLRSYPKFYFPDNQACTHCIPYNGHYTINYWATGQKDCW